VAGMRLKNLHPYTGSAREPLLRGRQLGNLNMLPMRWWSARMSWPLQAGAQVSEGRWQCGGCRSRHRFLRSRLCTRTPVTSAAAAFMLIRPEERGGAFFVDFPRNPPARATETMYQDARQCDPNLSVLGYKAVGVPGSVKGVGLPLSSPFRQAGSATGAGTGHPARHAMFLR